MVVRLAEALQVPLRERNALLLAAGYAPFYRHTQLEEPEIEVARQAVEFLLKQQEPYPAVVVDRYWNTLKVNAAAQRFLALFPECASVTPRNGIRLIFHPQGLRPFIENWENVASRLLQRVHREVSANPSDKTMKDFLKELIAFPGVPSRWNTLNMEGSPLPFLTINYKYKNRTQQLFSTITTFGTPQDVALQELRIESFFPADEPTRSFLIGC